MNKNVSLSNDLEKRVDSLIKIYERDLKRLEPKVDLVRKNFKRKLLYVLAGSLILGSLYVGVRLGYKKPERIYTPTQLDIDTTIKKLKEVPQLYPSPQKYPQPQRQRYGSFTNHIYKLHLEAERTKSVKRQSRLSNDGVEYKTSVITDSSEEKKELEDKINLMEEAEKIHKDTYSQIKPWPKDKINEVPFFGDGIFDVSGNILGVGIASPDKNKLLFLDYNKNYYVVNSDGTNLNKVMNNSRGIIGSFGWRNNKTIEFKIYNRFGHEEKIYMELNELNQNIAHSITK